MEMTQPEEAMKMFQQASEILGSTPNCNAAMLADFQREALRAKSAMLSGKSEAEILKMEGNDAFKAGKIDEAVKIYTRAMQVAKPDEANCKADILANRAACKRQLYE